MPQPNVTAAPSKIEDTQKHHRRDRRRGPPGGRRIAAIKQELGDTMNEYVAVFRDADGLARERTRSSAGSRRRRPQASDRRPRVDLQPGRDRGNRARLHARLRRGDHRRPRSSARSHAARSSAPISPSATTTNGSNTSTSRSTGPTSRSMSYSPVTITPLAARGKDLLTTNACVHLENSPASTPESGRGGALGRAHDRAPPAKAARSSTRSSRSRPRRTARSASAARVSRESADRVGCE